MICGLLIYYSESRERLNGKQLQIKSADCLMRGGCVGGRVGGGLAPLAAQGRAGAAPADGAARAWQSGSEVHRSGKCRTCADGCGVDIADMRRRVLRETLTKVFEAHD